MASGAVGFREEEAQATEGIGQHGVTEGHRVGVTPGLFLLCMLHAPVLWRPEPDYCAGIQPQSVFIRERAKIIQEGSGPLIHLKWRMKRGGGWSGGCWWGLKGGLWVILKGENPVERP